MYLREAEGRVERRPQLVGHVGQELGLVPARDLKLAALVESVGRTKALVDRTAAVGAGATAQVQGL